MAPSAAALALAACAVVFAGCGGSTTPPPASPADGGDVAPTGLKVLLVGLDAADWQIAGPLADAGRLPRLASMRSRGAWGTLRSMVPVLSPLLWTSVATGATADQHGVIDFLVPDPATGKRTPVQSSARRLPALWDHFTAWSRTSDVVAWWATWPAEPISGRLVSDRVAYSLFGVAPPASSGALTWPPALLDEIRPAFVADEQITWDDVRRFLDISRAEFDAARQRLRDGGPDAQSHPVSHFIRILAATRTYHSVALSLLARGQADFTAVYYQGIDEVCHRFIHFAPPALEGIDPEDVRRYGRAVEAFYEYQDELLGELLARVDDSTVVMVVSDHGFLNGPDRLAGKTADIEGQPARWHRRHGVVLLSGPPVRAGKLDTSSLLDVAPTVLHLAGLPIPDTMPGRVLSGALDPAFLSRFPERRRPPAGLPPMRTAAAAPRAPADEGDDAGAEEMMAALRSLGYIGGGSPSRPEPPAGAPGAAPEHSIVPDTLTAHANMAGIHLSAGDLPRAEQEIEAALRLAPAAAQPRMLLFDLRMRQRRYPEAIAVGEQLLKGDTDLLGDLFLARLAGAYREAGALRRGVDLLQREVAKGRWRMGSALARLHREAGRPEAARDAARAVLARDPLDESAMAVLVHLHQQAPSSGGAVPGSLAPLEPALREALGRNPRSIMHLNWMALLNLEAGDAAGAAALLESALDVNPDHPATMANLGAVHLKTGRPDLALPVLVRAVDLAPANVEARVNLGTVWAMKGRYQDAIREFETVWRGGYRRPAVARALARAWAELGQAEAARQWLAEASASPKTD